jgi:glycosyltransferase involved in cell wall biosynthesis
VPPRDKTALAEAIIRCHEDGGNSNDMALKGYERVKEHYSAERMAQQYLEIYRGMLLKEGC